ncbi:hypothetical protein GJ496_001363 [Pomphorhynchus laevis]|nr:hypothetical protein GJ496_001363 [Pomphorhynchus laevis]
MIPHAFENNANESTSFQRQPINEILLLNDDQVYNSEEIDQTKNDIDDSIDTPSDSLLLPSNHQRRNNRSTSKITSALGKTMMIIYTNYS